MSLLSPPPTYADLLIVDETTKKPTFNPIWMSWFLTMVGVLNNSGGASGITHNNLSGLQGGTSGQYYHQSLASYNALNYFLSGGLVVQHPVTTTAATYTILNTEFSILFNGTGTIVTLPAASGNTGQLYLLQTLVAQTVISASSNVVPLGATAPGTAILAATIGKFALLQSDGTNWITLMAN